MSRYLEKISRLRQIIKHNGGIVGSFLMLYRTDELKFGDLVGKDKYGNHYYENNMYFFGRNRWVVYSREVNMNYDASQVPGEWHGWLHNMTRDPPTVVPPVNYPWLVDHVENLSGAAGQYVPYSTTRPKIESWVPPKSS